MFRKLLYWKLIILLIKMIPDKFVFAYIKIIKFIALNN